MKTRNIFLIFFFTMGITSLIAQVTVDENNKVGVGTDTPVKKFEVIGEANINNGNNSIIIGTSAAQTTPGAMTYSNIFGYEAAFAATGGFANNLFGFQAGYSITSGGLNNFFGSQAGKANTSGARNNFFGFQAGLANLGGSNNNFFGSEAGKSNTSGSFNNFFGASAGLANTSGQNNNFFGNSAGKSNTSGRDNNFFGANAGLNSGAASYNNFFGANAGQANTSGEFNNFFGYQSGYKNNSGKYNTFLGYQSGYNNTTGRYNDFIGLLAGKDNTTAYYNISIGTLAGRYNTTGSRNTSIGTYAGPLNSTGTNYTNSTAIGYEAKTTASNQVRIGNTSVSSIGGYEDWTNFSDQRLKNNIREDVKGLDFILSLRPVTYNMDVNKINAAIESPKHKEINALNSDQATFQKGIQEKSQIRYSGFLAQEVEQTAKKLGYNFSGVDAPKNSQDYYGLRYATFVVPLVKAVQELALQNKELKNIKVNVDALVNRLENKIEGLEAINAQMQQDLEQLKLQVAELLSDKK